MFLHKSGLVVAESGTNSPRSGFSFLPTSDGIALYGGYCNEYTKGKRPVGVILDDTWLLKMTLDPALPTPLALKWERRKTVSSTHMPTAHAGCRMALWLAKSTGVMFGWVTDEERVEEGLESAFWNDLYGYQLGGNGRWIAMHLKRPKKKGGGKKKQPKRGGVTSTLATQPNPEPEHDDDAGPDDPNSTRPMPRYNAMLAVLRNTLYIYGGIFELGTREYTLDDFYTLQLDKLDPFVCLKSSGIVIPTEAEESSDDEHEEGEGGGSDKDEGEDEDSEGVSDSEDESGEEPEGVIETDAKPGAPSETLEAEMPVDKDLRARATVFMGVAERNTTRSAEDVISTPAPGETLATFYARSRKYWAQKAHQEQASDSRSKQLRRDGFGLAEARYGESIMPGFWLSRAQSEMKLQAGRDGGCLNGIAEKLEAERAAAQEFIDMAEPLAEEQALREQYTEAGFHDWRQGRKGRKAVLHFKKHWKELAEHPRIAARITEGDAQRNKQSNLEYLLSKKIGFLKHPVQELELNYPTTKGKVYSEEEDRYLLCRLNHYGMLAEDVYERIKRDISEFPVFRFDWFFKSRSTQEV
ncbi:hypothetical protein JVU11DRAFT_12599 [Chiua virens]|nr:hypothetical protein JVU11DRAFT_12599 [Chiua virens]